MSRRIQVQVKPNSKDEALEEQPDGSWIARIKAPPVDGKANAALIALIARHFGLHKAQVNIRSGASGRQKWIEMAD